MTTQMMEAPITTSFPDRMTEILNSATVSLMVSVGHRTRLFDTMAGMSPATSEEIARRAGLSERYVREWLGAMVTGHIVEYDPTDRTYVLPPEHAAFLTRAAEPANLAMTCQWIAVLGSVEDEVVEAFRHGRGVPYSAYKRFHSVMAEESAQTVVAALMDHILPLVPGLEQKLMMGMRVLDMGCGAGKAMGLMAKRFPKSRFMGYDFSEEAIVMARTNAEAQGLTNVQFMVRDAAEVDDRDMYDMVTAFDAIHDQARPDRVLANIHRAIKPGGVFLMQDIAASSHVHMNVDQPIAPFIYTISCMHCMSVSLANHGMGLGAAWGREKAVEMLNEAEFTDVRVEQLEHDIMNYYYVMHKHA